MPYSLKKGLNMLRSRLVAQRELEGIISEMQGSALVAVREYADKLAMAMQGIPVLNCDRFADAKEAWKEYWASDSVEFGEWLYREAKES